MTCFLCGVGISWDVSNTKGKKTKKGVAIDNVTQRTIWIASVGARHMRAEYAEGKGEMTVGAKEIATSTKKSKDTLVQHAA